MSVATVRRILSSPWSGLVLFLAALTAPLFTDNYTQYVLNLAISFILATLGQQIILGFAGQFAFHNAILMGLGAYTVAVLTQRVGVNFFVALPIAGLVSAVIGALVVLPAIRLNHAYLGVVTVAFAELGQWIFAHWKSVTLGTDGIKVPRPTLLGFTFAGDKLTYYVVLAATVVMLLLVRRLMWSRLGRAFLIIKENETVARCCGINVPLYKGIAFALSGFCAGWGGGLYAISVGFLVPYGFGVLMMVLHFTIVVIGGIGTFAGAIVGSLLLTMLPELLRDFKAYQEMLYGLLLIVFIVFWPRGIVGLLMKRNIMPKEILVHRWWRHFDWTDRLETDRRIDRFGHADSAPHEAAAPASRAQ